MRYERYLRILLQHFQKPQEYRSIPRFTKESRDLQQHLLGGDDAPPYSSSDGFGPSMIDIARIQRRDIERCVGKNDSHSFGTPCLR